jgi:hypothetical protein
MINPAKAGRSSSHTPVMLDHSVGHKLTASVLRGGLAYDLWFNDELAKGEIAL